MKSKDIYLLNFTVRPVRAILFHKRCLYMKKVYLAIFKVSSDGYEIRFPDVENAIAKAKTIDEGLENAAEILGRSLAELVENSGTWPEPSNINELSIDSKIEFSTLISVDLSDYLKDSRLDKKTIKIPHWLNVRATNEGINFSKTMTEALLKKLNIQGTGGKHSGGH